MAEKKDNMELWGQVSTTDKKHTKEVSYGKRKFTSIDAQYQLMLATEQFGIYGDKWKLDDVVYREISFKNDKILLVLHATFKHPFGAFPISTSLLLQYYDSKGKLVVDDEAFKKIETDATTKALSKLGFNADVFLGQFDGDRYSEPKKTQPRQSSKLEPAKEPDIRVTISQSNDMSAVAALDAAGRQLYPETWDTKKSEWVRWMQNKVNVDLTGDEIDLTASEIQRLCEALDYKFKEAGAQS